MADGPFRGEEAFRELQPTSRRVDVDALRRERRTAAFDASLGFVGAAAATVHWHAPWYVLFVICHVTWVFPVAVAVYSAYGAWNAIVAIRLHRRIAASD